MTNNDSKTQDSRIVTFRVSNKELDRINQMAKEAGLNRSQYIAKKCLSDTKNITPVGATLNYLEKMGKFLTELKKGKMRNEDFLKNADKE